ncbi:hypothetical protein MNBD_GAMMA12-2003 [hydrothermal vent metagenome]|uniref:Uncharacterized protein n=1 Tax=hydrothermal vent metagenome TaxID=652676 RepID=A0A3B0Z2W2_9ZZZZ
MTNTRNIFLYLIAMVLLVACDTSNIPETAVSVDLGSKQTNKVLHDDGILKFNSKNLYKGDTLSITLPVPHPKELAIKAPNGTWFYLHVENEGATEMLMPKEKFAALKELDLDTGKLEARYWDDGKAMRGKVFAETGTYLIYMANNLETEPDNTLHFSSLIQYSTSTKSSY